MAEPVAMDSDADDILQRLAAGDSMDYSTWPLLLATVVSRLEKTALNDFPTPRIPQPAAAPPPPSPGPRFLAPLPPSSDPAPSSSDPEPPAANTTTGGPSSSDPSSEETNKENAAPFRASPLAAPPSVAAPAPRAPAIEPEPGTLPPQITAMLAEITGVLTETFHTYPPHTIQRLSELVLEPRKHYKSLPAYLHAVDRVVHVTSGNNIYPLPPTLPDMRHMHTNGTTTDNSASASAARDDHTADQELPTQAVWASNSNGSVPIGSDEALGGALLTPIPWLARRAANGGGDGGSESGESSPVPAVSSSSAQTGRQGRQFENMQVRTESTETIEGPNGMGSIETVSVSINGVSSMSAAQQQRVISQGELIRQEQRAGVVPLNRSGPVVVTSASTREEAPDTAMGEGDADDGTSKDTNSEQSDDDMGDDEEAPHARGPDLIGAADMGPQTGSASTFSISRAGNAEVVGIDVEAAVGRKHEAQVPSPHPNAPAADTSDTSGDDAPLPTPASSEAEPSTEAAAEPVQETVEGEGPTAEEAPAEINKEDDAKTEGDSDVNADMDKPESKSAIVGARSSPVKREAEDDISEAESEPKRLKGSILDNENAASGAADVPADTGAVAAEPASVESEVGEGAEPQPEESKDAATKGGEGDSQPC